MQKLAKSLKLSFREKNQLFSQVTPDNACFLFVVVIVHFVEDLHLESQPLKATNRTEPNKQYKSLVAADPAMFVLSNHPTHKVNRPTTNLSVNVQASLSPWIVSVFGSVAFYYFPEASFC